jgi:putative transposase
MINGVKFKVYPSEEQKASLSQWMGAQRYIWNAKVEEEKYFRTFGRKFFPKNLIPKPDQCYAHFKSKELCPWIYRIPSQILRNSASHWYTTFKNFIAGECGRPKYKKRRDERSVLITRELFCIKKEGKQTYLYLGTEKNSIGRMIVAVHRSFSEPASIRIKVRSQKWTVSFCYGEAESKEIEYQRDCLSLLQDEAEADLRKKVVGIDRGTKVAFQVGDLALTPNDQAKRIFARRSRYLKRQQRALARQGLASKRRAKTKQKINKVHLAIANARLDFLHKATFSLCKDESSQVFVFEDLRVKNMSRAPSPKKREDGKGFERNGAKVKARLNRAILEQAWSKFETILRYKSRRYGKVCYRVPPQFSSQECADCGHICAENRQSRDAFCCQLCGHRDHADRNAAMVLKKRAINLILDSGSELSDRGVLTLRNDKGRGAKSKPRKAKADLALGCEASKKKKKAPKPATVIEPSLEVCSFRGR